MCCLLPCYWLSRPQPSKWHVSQSCTQAGGCPMHWIFRSEDSKRKEIGEKIFVVCKKSFVSFLNFYVKKSQLRFWLEKTKCFVSRMMCTFTVKIFSIPKKKFNSFLWTEAVLPFPILFWLTSHAELVSIWRITSRTVILNRGATAHQGATKRCQGSGVPPTAFLWMYYYIRCRQVIIKLSKRWLFFCNPIFLFLH